MNIGIIPLPEFTLSTLSLFLDPIRLASEEKELGRQVRCQWKIMTLNGLPVRSSCGVELNPTARIQDDIKDLDWLVVVGGVSNPARSSASHERVVDILKQADRKGIGIIGICTGVFRMAEAGLLRGEKCCVSWYLGELFAESYAEVEPDLRRHFILGKKKATCAGGIGSFFLANEIIRQEFGMDFSKLNSDIMIMPRFYTSDLEQPMPEEYGDASPRIRDALRFMQMRLENPPKTSEIARATGISPRQLERIIREELGLTPKKLMSSLQIRKARALIEKTDWPIIDIAVACGFSSGTLFARAFRKSQGVTPSSFRAKRNATGLFANI